jgi:hypothetical protein
VEHHVDELHKALRDLYPQLTFFVRGRFPDQLTSTGPVVMIVGEDGGCVRMQSTSTAA